MKTSISIFLLAAAFSASAHILTPDFPLAALFSGDFLLQNGNQTHSGASSAKQSLSWNFKEENDKNTVYSQFNFQSEIIPKLDDHKDVAVNSQMKPVEIINPKMNYITPIPEKAAPGMSIRIQGRMHCSGSKFAINLMNGSTPRYDDNDILLHVNPRLSEGQVVLNSQFNRNWDAEDERSGQQFPFAAEQFFDLVISLTPTHFQIISDGEHFADYKYRAGIERITHLYLEGAVTIYRVRFEHSPDTQNENEGRVNLQPRKDCSLSIVPIEMMKSQPAQDLSERENNLSSEFR